MDMLSNLSCHEKITTGQAHFQIKREIALSAPTTNQLCKKLELYYTCFNLRGSAKDMILKDKAY